MDHDHALWKPVRLMYGSGNALVPTLKTSTGAIRYRYYGLYTVTRFSLKTFASYSLRYGKKYESKQFINSALYGL